jgi:hypothetical protein
MDAASRELKAVSNPDNNYRKLDNFAPWGSKLVPGMRNQFEAHNPAKYFKQIAEPTSPVINLAELVVVEIPEPIILQELANIAGRKPFQIIADLMLSS